MLAVPLPTTKSLAVKPVTLRLKLTVTEKGVIDVGLASLVLSNTVSCSMINVEFAALLSVLLVFTVADMLEVALLKTPSEAPKGTCNDTSKVQLSPGCNSPALNIKLVVPLRVELPLQGVVGNAIAVNVGIIN